MLDEKALTIEVKKHLKERGKWYATRLIDMYNEPSIKQRNEVTFECIRRNFSQIKSVAIVGSVNPIPLMCSLMNAYHCSVTLIGDHALTEACIDFYAYHFNASVRLMNPFFNKLDYSAYDLVVVPEFEYFVPLKMLESSNIDGAAFMCTHHLHHIVDHNTVFDVFNIDDLKEHCGFKTLVDAGVMMCANGRKIHYALGIT